MATGKVNIGSSVLDTLPEQVSSLTAVVSPNAITVTLVNNNRLYLNGYVITYKAGSVPKNVNDGTKITLTNTTSSTVSTTINGLTNNTTYYIRCFPYNSKRQYQTEYKVVSATPKAGTPLKDLPVGTIVKDPNTKYYGQPIEFMVLEHNHTGYPSGATTLVSKKVICVKSFDASESKTGTSRLTYGNNRYSFSNLRQWLNKDVANWYLPTHEYDNPPSVTYVESKKNAYDTESGFLTNFSSKFKSILLNTSLTVVLSSEDGGGSEIVTDKIFLLSSTELGLSNQNNIAEGIKFDYFSDTVKRAFYPTQECITNSEIKDSMILDVSKVCTFWLRTPYYSNGYKSCGSNGSLQTGLNPRYGGTGVLPALNVSGNNVVSLTPNSDGSYNLML